MLLARRLLRLGLVLLLAATLLGASAFAILYWMIVPSLPSVEALREVRLQVPLSVYSEEGLLVAQFGETRRYPIRIEDVPEVVKQAFIATEDARFYEHPGIDWRGISRAVWLLATTSDRRVPGGSTITQQVAKMFFLSPEYSYSRKLTEIFLALKMEKELSKDEILALYLNKSFFGNRAYGVVAAAEFYYGKTLADLTLEEAAMLASIPKFPSSGNPVVNPRRAMVRRNHVLGRMLDEGFIDARAHELARAEPDRAHPHEPPIELEAPWVAEMVRQEAVARFGEQAMIDGYRVVTTLQARAQEAANQATRNGLLAYDRRHGWRGTEGRVELPDGASPQAWTALLRDYRPVVGLLPAVVLETHADAATLGLADGQTVDLPLARMKWAQPYLSPNSRGPAPRQPSDFLGRGDIIRVARDAEGEWELAQIPTAQGTVVAIDAETGAIRALTGGFSFGLNKFNRATQTARQPGSSFKPFVYAAAFERGFTPASIVLDAPVVYDDRGSGQRWSPKNDNQVFSGPMRLREAMVSSRNLVSVRILDAIGVPFARRYIQNFGFAPETLPDGPSLALGTSSAPPLAMARGYATFANGGFLIEPWFIARIEDRDGQLLFEATPARACARCPERLAQQQIASGGDDGFNLGNSAESVPASLSSETTLDADAADPTLAPRAIDERTAYLIHSLLLDVVKRGTGRRALALGRSDIGGKTGTTNDSRDAWFSGFGGPLVVSAWVGMDDFSTLGSREFGNTAALPIWIDFMRGALEGVPEHRMEMPEGIATALIDRDSGRLAAPGGNGALAELFKVEDLRRLELRGEAPGEDADKEAFDIF
jgi:penicillin-binding protein 1A